MKQTTMNSHCTQPSYNYDYVLDGTGVDMVIAWIQESSRSSQSGKILDGAPRLQQIDWFAESEYQAHSPTNFYTDTNGHGTHCIGTMAGKYFGWAQERKNL